MLHLPSQDQSEDMSCRCPGVGGSGSTSIADEAVAESGVPAALTVIALAAPTGPPMDPSAGLKRTGPLAGSSCWSFH